MIIKKEYKNKNIISCTVIDNIDKIDEGRLDDGCTFINVYKKDRQKEDDFETINILNITVYVMTDSGKTIQIYRSK